MFRLDDYVWAECQRLGKEYGTINEGLAAALTALKTQEAQGRVMAETGDPWKAVEVNLKAMQTWKRGPRPKGDKIR